MKTINQVLDTSKLHEGYFLTVETFNREKFYLPLKEAELQTISKFALSGMHRKKVIKHFISCTSDQPKDHFLHIEDWIKDILKNSTSAFFTVQMDHFNFDEINTPVPYLKKFFFKVTP
ncbi:hypothetical protein [Acinetobacter celticus]|uniref:Uncharacterized protein n=1 Tax=Acinetobacter celticus TaxID=1891224 RepID=A0A1C3CUQ9_9GAMM|nr:hypothetical protein [Acinetobacter celticus]ODA12458.1 hypothetical protein BBP83_11260 [Acinetobacter celticus]